MYKRQNLLNVDVATVGPDGFGFVHNEIFDATVDDPNPNAFSDSKTTTHLSPLFEQSFQAELPIFSQVPVLRNVRQLQGARLRLGYSWLWVGEVASPNQSVRWQANPRAGLFPSIDLLRDDYSISTVNFGLSWDF